MMNVVFKTSVCVSYWADFTDEELVGEYRIFNDQRCFEELTRRYWTSLARFLKRRYKLSDDQVEEALQATFSRVWQKLDQFDVTRRFHPWIYRIATSQTINLLRESGRRSFAVSLDAPSSEDSEKGTWANEIEGRDVDPQQEMERLDAATGVRRAMAKLPLKFRQILELDFFQGWSRQSVAEALHLTVSTVSRRITRALEQLSFYLFNEQPELYRERAAFLVRAEAS